jgi:predicted peptidase
MKAAVSRYCVAVLSYVVFTSATAASPFPQTGQHTREHRVEDSSAKRRYLLFLPEGYGEDERKWPLIVYLHGASVRGTNLDRVKRYGLPWLVENRRDFPFIVISPQCPTGTRWVDLDTGCVMDVLDAVCAEYAVDTDRIYLTGVSMGGHGAWYLASRHPDRFAAVAPLCGRADTSWVESLRSVPAWVFHGERDRVCPKSYSDRMVAALDSLGATVKYTLYPGAGHDIVTRTYKNEELYEWFLLHRRNPGGLSAR